MGRVRVVKAPYDKMQKFVVMGRVDLLPSMSWQSGSPLGRLYASNVSLVCPNLVCRACFGVAVRGFRACLRTVQADDFAHAVGLESSRLCSG